MLNVGVRNERVKLLKVRSSKSKLEEERLQALALLRLNLWTYDVDGIGSVERVFEDLLDALLKGR